MDLKTLPPFLHSSKKNVDTAVYKSLGDIHVVLGNEAADLDSVISTVVTAFYIAHSIYKEEKENKPEEQSFVLPVINCTREDLPLRTEVVYYLNENGINIDCLICRDEIDLSLIHGGGRLKLTLVDHNLMAPGDLAFSSSVVRVIDHHKRERPLDRRDTIELVGSCCTLVAEMVLGLFDKDLLVCKLLYGTIILDTFNFLPSAQRTTPKDIKMATELEECLGLKGGANRNDLFKALFGARADVSQLTSEQILRKDCKILRTPQISISLPAVPLSAQELLQFPNIVEALRGNLRSNNCKAIVILSVIEVDGEIKKDIIVFSDSIVKAKQITTPLENSELDLHLIRSSIETQSVIFAYHQRNIALSRKYVLPFLKNYFETKNNQDVDGLNGVDIIMPLGGNGDISPNKFPLSPLPSISYTGVSSLGVGDPISQSGSSQNSAYNSCPYTPQNSHAEPNDGIPYEDYFLPSFNSRDMIEKIELKRGKLRGYDKSEDELKPSSYPFTPKNSYVESTLESVFEQPTQIRGGGGGTERGFGILHGIDSDYLVRKLMEKRREPNSLSSNSSSKSQSLTKLNTDELIEIQSQSIGSQSPIPPPS